MSDQSDALQTARPDVAVLLERCADGDEVAWDEIVSRYERLVYAIPVREGLDPDAAADVTQETFAALIRSLDRITEPERLGAWLMTVSRRLTWRRRAQVRATSPLETIDIEIDDASDAAVESLWVYEAMHDLDDLCRGLITALFFDPAAPSYSEIAVSLGRPVGSIGPLRSRCLDRLRGRLEETEA